MYKNYILLAGIACIAASVALATDEDLVVVEVPLKHSRDADSVIETQDFDVAPDGFKYDFEASNHVRARAHGDEKNNVHGDFAWISPEGVHVELSYEADELGYRPHGDVLPTPHPVPDYIVRALEYIKAHPFESIKKGHEDA